MGTREILYKKLFKSNFARNIALIAGSTAFAQVMGVLFLPMVTRIYPPEQYGVLTVYTAVLELLAVSASLDYQKAIPIAEDDEKAVNLVVLSIVILSIVVASITIVLALWGDTFLAILNSQVLTSYKYLIPVGIFFVAMYNIFLQWAFRARNYKLITKTKINQSIASNLLKVFLGWLKIGPIGLIFGTIIGQSAGIITLSLPLILNKRLVKSVSFVEIMRMRRRYIKFPLYLAPSNYVYTAANQLPVIFLITFFDSSVVGLFGLANSVLNMPLDLIGNSIAQVFYAEMAKIGKDNPIKIRTLSFSLLKKLAVIGLFPLITILLFGSRIFSFIFGYQWHDASIYAGIISFMVYFHFLILPLGRILEIFERQREGLILNIVRLLLILLVFGVAKYLKLNSFTTITMYAILTSISYILSLFMVFIIMNSEIENQSL